MYTINMYYDKYFVSLVWECSIICILLIISLLLSWYERKNKLYNNDKSDEQLNKEVFIEKQNSKAFTYYSSILVKSKKSQKASFISLFLMFMFIVYCSAVILPRFISTYKDIRNESLPVYTVGILEETGHKDSNNIVINGKKYYLYTYYDSINKASNIGKEVKFSYYPKSNCIYTIELLNDEEQ